MSIKTNLLILIGIIFFLIPTDTFSQSKTFNSGVIYWGGFDLEKSDISGEMEIYGYIDQLKVIDKDYYVYAKDTKGKNFKLKFSKVFYDPDFDNKYIDDNGNQYLIMPVGNNLNILCLELAMAEFENIYMLLQIIVE